MVVLYQTPRWNNDPTGKCIRHPFDIVTDHPIVTLAPVNHWSTIEVQITIVCACLPISRAMLVRFFPRLAGSSDGQSNPYQTGKANRPTGGSRAPESQIAKTVEYSVNYSASRPQQRDSGGSDSMVQLVDIGPRSHE